MQMKHYWGIRALTGQEDTMTRTSRSGYVFQIGDTPVLWNSNRKSVIVALSVEVEYIAQIHAVKEPLQISIIFQEFDVFVDSKPFKVYVEISCVIALANDTIISNRSNHTDKGLRGSGKGDTRIFSN